MTPGRYLEGLFSLTGKTVLVTGATGGIGSALSDGFARAGADLVMAARDPGRCADLVDRLVADGCRASARRLDVRDPSSIDECVSGVIGDHGRVDVLVNVAGINVRRGLLDLDSETYDAILDTNLKGVFFLTQRVARHMARAGSGNIINIGSHNDAAMLGGCSAYGASKSGVIAFTRALAVELARYGVRANAISPGHILTGLTQVTWDDPARAAYLTERIALRRPGRPEELVGVAIMLASDASSYLSGATLRVDGGCLAGGSPWPYDTADWGADA